MIQSIDAYTNNFFGRLGVGGPTMGITPLDPGSFERSLAVAADQFGTNPGDGIIDRTDLHDYIATHFDHDGNGVLDEQEQYEIARAFDPTPHAGPIGPADAYAARLYARNRPDRNGDLHVNAVADPALRGFLQQADYTNQNFDGKVDYGDIARTVNAYAHGDNYLGNADTYYLRRDHPGLG